ncbi:hypothetical protein C8N24_6272 [Solirubrobacter pauli]|uniref:Uncharacterized protein n=1 Tax=Solirubrobacter pauli TaxID=166793 RepID=A0A660L9K6_9ACTN|nr:hypothetical protein [Solirubrobacter pauli]RKQ88230.1 hypothetical protein C8N24_6272 [Solirubrobacter pauli]
MKTSAVLSSSNGHDSVTLTRVDDVLYVVVCWVPQRWDVAAADPPASEITLYREGLPDALRQLSDDLAAHLQRPLQDLAGNPFLGSYEFGSPHIALDSSELRASHAQLALEFTDAREGFISTRSNGGGYVSVRWHFNDSFLRVAMRVDITTLDRFARELADLVN